MTKTIAKFSLIAALAFASPVAHAQDTISLKPGESSRLRPLTWTSPACGNLLESVEGLDILESPSADLKLRFEPAKVTVARPGCSQLVDGFYVFVEAGKIEQKLSGTLVVRARLKSKTGPVQSTYRYSLLLYPATAEEKK